MARTLLDYATQIGNLPVIDVRTFGAKGDGSTDDTVAIQNALDAAAIAGGNGPCIVQLPRGRFGTTTALKFKHDGIVLQGFGMMGIGDTLNSAITDNTCSILYALSGHDATPMVQMTPADCNVGIGNQGWYRGTALRDISIDVSNAAAFTSGTPPSVLFMRGLSNCPEFQNVVVYGNIGTAFDIGMYTAFGLICENLIFRNCYAYAGYLPGGSSRGVVPTAPAVSIAGADNIQFVGGLFGYLYTSTLPVNDNLSDVPAVAITPALRVGGPGGIVPGSCTFERVAITNYVVSFRTSSVDFSGQNYGVAIARFTDCIIENYNKAFQINQETAVNTPGFWRSRIYVKGLLFSGAFGTNTHLVQGSKMVGGIVELPWLQITGDLLLDATTAGVRYYIGPDPNGVGFFSQATDNGNNFGNYAKTGLKGRLISGQLRAMGNTSPTTATASPDATADVAIQAWGNTSQLFSSQRNLGANFLTVAGNFGEVVVWKDGASQWWLGVCVLGGAAGAANWVRTPLNIW